MAENTTDDAGGPRALVVYESMYGNTREIAEAVAEGLAAGWAVTVRSVHEPDIDLDGVQLLVVGGPTHMHGLSSSMSRKAAAEAAKEDEHALEPSATEGPGLRRWLRALPKADGGAAAAFDTRADRSAGITGSAARGIARRLRHRGYEVEHTQSFLVEDSEGPLEPGELERARTWGAALTHAAPSAR